MSIFICDVIISLRLGVGGRGNIEGVDERMNNFFKLKEHNVTFKGEVLAALTSFFAAIYIIVVNASILSDAHIAMEPLIISTVFASFTGCMIAAFVTNAPLIIMPGMGINALVTYTIVNTLGLTFYEALAAIFVAGILLAVIALTPLSKILMDAIPHTLKESITIGIGLFVAFLGLQKSGLVVASSSTLVTIGKINSPEVILFIFIMILTLVLFLKNVRGSFLISIILGTVLSIVFGLVDTSTLKFSLPDFNSYKDIFFNMSFNAIGNINFWIGTFSLTLILVFENIGILYAQTHQLLGAPEKASKSLAAVSFATIGCALLGCSPPVSTVEGNAGMTDGGRTGLTSVICGILFLASLFFIPFINIIPNIAIAPILIILGCLMAQNLKNMKFQDFSDFFPCFVTIISIPFTYSIIDGIALGFILYPICKICTKKQNEISIPMYIIAAIFLLYFIIIGLIH